MCPVSDFLQTPNFSWKQNSLLDHQIFTCDLSQPPAPNQGVGADLGQQIQTEIQFKLDTGGGHNSFSILKHFLTVVLLTVCNNFIILTDT